MLFTNLIRLPVFERLAEVAEAGVRHTYLTAVARQFARKLAENADAAGQYGAPENGYFEGERAISSVSFAIVVW